MKLQNYKDGEIHKVGAKYQYVHFGKVVGTYNNVTELVKAQEQPKKRRRKKHSAKADLSVSLDTSKQ